MAIDEADCLIREQEAEERDATHHEQKKKKPKINRSVGSFIAPQPLTYALNKLENVKYVKLFYFTHKGFDDSLMEFIPNEIWDAEHVENKREVSTPAFSSFPS